MSENIKIDWLKGVKVLLVAHYIPGPLAAYLLKWLGAEIIKVEPPFGDYMRGLPPFIRNGENKMSAYFRAINGGFKSVVVDFKKDKGRDILADLIDKCDLVIDGNRAGALQSLLGRKVTEVNPQIIHIPVTGHGLKGPLRDTAAHDNNLLAMTGALSYTNSVFGCQLADITAGYMAAFMAVSSLLGKRNSQSTSEVNVIDASMIHAASFLNQIYIAGLNATGRSPMPEKELLNGSLPNYRSYKSKDGKGLFFGPIEPKLFKNFCECTGNQHFVELLGKDNESLHTQLEKTFASRDLDEWKDLLKDCDCCFSPVNDLQDAIKEPQLEALQLVHKVDDPLLGNLTLSGYPAGFGEDSKQPDVALPAPLLGEHTFEVVRDILAYDDDVVDSLIKERIIIGDLV